MIYEVYGGGGNSGAIYKNDYVVLYNGTNTDINLEGYTLQYASKSGSFSISKTMSVSLTGTITSKGYYLIKLAGETNGAELPTPNITGNISMSSTQGKVALVNGTTAISGSSDPMVVDFVGFGSANDFEGAAAPAPSNSTSIKRAAFVDTDNNSTDFGTTTPDLSYLNP